MKKHKNACNLSISALMKVSWGEGGSVLFKFTSFVKGIKSYECRISLTPILFNVHLVEGINEYICD